MRLLSRFIYSSVFFMSISLKLSAQLTRISPKGMHYFNVGIIDKTIILKWNNDPGTKCRYYIVERSKDDINYEEIAMVFEGNVKPNMSYKLKDAPAEKGMYYYRLRAFGLDEKVRSSTIVAFNYFGSDASFSIYPNPVKEQINILYPLLANENLSLSITDIAGKVVKVYPLDPMKSKFTVERAGLEKGIYFYTFISNDEILAEGKFMVTE